MTSPSRLRSSSQAKRSSACCRDAWNSARGRSAAARCRADARSPDEVGDQPATSKVPREQPRPGHNSASSVLREHVDQRSSRSTPTVRTCFSSRMSAETASRCGCSRDSTRFISRDRACPDSTRRLIAISTVRREANPLFYDILKAFHRRTGCPMPSTPRSTSAVSRFASPKTRIAASRARQWTRCGRQFHVPPEAGIPASARTLGVWSSARWIQLTERLFGLRRHVAGSVRRAADEPGPPRSKGRYSQSLFGAHGRSRSRWRRWRSSRWCFRDGPDVVGWRALSALRVCGTGTVVLLEPSREFGNDQPSHLSQHRHEDVLPGEIMPLAQVGSRLVDLGAASGLFVVLLVSTGSEVGPEAIVAPVFVALLVLFTIGVTLLTSASTCSTAT